MSWRDSTIEAVRSSLFMYQFWILSGATIIYIGLLVKIGTPVWLLPFLVLFLGPWSLRVYYSMYRQRYTLLWAYETQKQYWREKKPRKEKKT